MLPERAKTIHELLSEHRGADYPAEHHALGKPDGIPEWVANFHANVLPDSRHRGAHNCNHSHTFAIAGAHEFSIAGSFGESYVRTVNLADNLANQCGDVQTPPSLRLRRLRWRGLMLPWHSWIVFLVLCQHGSANHFTNLRPVGVAQRHSNRKSKCVPNVIADIANGGSDGRCRVDGGANVAAHDRSLRVAHDYTQHPPNGAADTLPNVAGGLLTAQEMQDATGLACGIAVLSDEKRFVHVLLPEHRETLGGTHRGPDRPDK